MLIRHLTARDTAMLPRSALVACLLALAGCTLPPGEGPVLVARPTIGTGGGGVSYSPPPVVFGFPGGASGGYYGAAPGGYLGGGSGWSGYGGSWGGPRSRTFRPDRRVVCDRGTQICYKRGEIDKSETEEAFGGRAGDRADRIRDKWGSDVYVRNRKVVCDNDRDVCFKNGRPDRSETRDVYGKKAARRL
jgi:hypothetical protein